MDADLTEPAFFGADVLLGWGVVVAAPAEPEPDADWEPDEELVPFAVVELTDTTVVMELWGADVVVAAELEVDAAAEEEAASELLVESELVLESEPPELEPEPVWTSMLW